MKILDKYLLKKFLKTYIFAVFVIVLIILVIDYVEKNDDFIQKNAPSSGGPQCSRKAVIKLKP